MAKNKKKVKIYSNLAKEGLNETDFTTKVKWKEAGLSFKDQQTIDNILIAEFMEFELSIINKCYHCTFINFLAVVPPAKLEFNSDWNWLMPVVEKIESIDFVVSMRQSSVTIFNNSGKMPYFQPHSVTGSKIKSTYKAVVKFIKWYNKQEK